MSRILFLLTGPTGLTLMFHHLFGPTSDGTEAAWQQWLTTLVA